MRDGGTERGREGATSRAQGREGRGEMDASRSRGGKEPPVKLSFPAIIAFRLDSSALFIFLSRPAPPRLVPPSPAASRRSTAGLLLRNPSRLVSRAFRTAKLLARGKSEPVISRSDRNARILFRVCFSCHFRIVLYSSTGSSCPSALYPRQFHLELIIRGPFANRATWARKRIAGLVAKRRKHRIRRRDEISMGNVDGKR